MEWKGLLGCSCICALAWSVGHLRMHLPLRAVLMHWILFKPILAGAAGHLFALSTCFYQIFGGSGAHWCRKDACELVTNAT